MHLFLHILCIYFCKYYAFIFAYIMHLFYIHYAHFSEKYYCSNVPVFSYDLLVGNLTVRATEKYTRCKLYNFLKSISLKSQVVF